MNEEYLANLNASGLTPSQQGMMVVCFLVIGASMICLGAGGLVIAIQGFRDLIRKKRP
jgi:hypothetical protein